MIGVIHDKGRPSSMAEHHIECFYAVKEDSDKAVEQKLAEQAKQQKLAEQEAADVQLLLIDQQEQTLTERRSRKARARKGKRTYKKNPLLEHVPSDETDAEISSIN